MASDCAPVECFLVGVGGVQKQVSNRAPPGPFWRFLVVF